MVKSRDATEDVDCSRSDAILVAERKVLIPDLQRQGNQDGLVRDLHIGGPDVEEERGTGEDLGGSHERLQILELDHRRSHQLGHAIQTVELLALVHLRHRTGTELLKAATGEAVSLASLPLLLVEGLACARNMLESIFLRAVDGHVVVAAHAAVDELDIDVVAHTLKVAVVPRLKRVGGGVAAALFHGPLVVASAGMRVDAVRLAVGDIDVTAVGLPSRLACGEVLVRIGDASIMRLAELILRV